MNLAQLQILRIETAYSTIELAHLNSADYFCMYRDGCINRDELSTFLAMHSATLLRYNARINDDFRILADCVL